MVTGVKRIIMLLLDVYPSVQACQRGAGSQVSSLLKGSRGRACILLWDTRGERCLLVLLLVFLAILAAPGGEGMLWLFKVANSIGWKRTERGQTAILFLLE